MKTNCTIEPNSRMLWVCYDGFGDVLQVLAYIKTFKDTYPKTHITLLTSPIYEAISKQNWVDAVLTGERGSCKKFRSVIAKLKKEEPYDFFVNLQNNRGETNLIGLLMRIPHKIGNGVSYFRYCYDSDFRSWAETLETDLRYRYAPIPLSSNPQKQHVRVLLKDLPSKKLFAIIGAGYKEKMWPRENWCAFLKPLVEQGWGIILNGHGEFEADFAKKIESNVNSPFLLNLVDKLNFCEMADVAAACDIAIGNDTGPLHLAAIQGIPTLGLFGGTSFAKVGLLMPTFRVAHTTCPYVLCGRMQKCNFRRNCLASISPEYVRAIFLQMEQTL